MKKIITYIFCMITMLVLLTACDIDSMLDVSSNNETESSSILNEDEQLLFEAIVAAFFTSQQEVEFDPKTFRVLECEDIHYIEEDETFSGKAFGSCVRMNIQYMGNYGSIEHGEVIYTSENNYHFFGGVMDKGYMIQQESKFGNIKPAHNINPNKINSALEMFWEYFKKNMNQYFEENSDDISLDESGNVIYKNYENYSYLGGGEYIEFTLQTVEEAVNYCESNSVNNKDN